MLSIRNSALDRVAEHFVARSGDDAVDDAARNRPSDSGAPLKDSGSSTRLAQSSLRSPFLIFLLVAAPALWLGYLMFTYGVDTPWGDQWDDTFVLIQKGQLGTLGLADFFAFHNEHRNAFPRAVTYALAAGTHWNVRAEMLIIWLLACCCSLNIWRLVRITGFRDSGHRIGLLLAANLLLLTPMQWENLLWGFQIVFLLPLACMTALPWAAYSSRRQLKFGLTLVLCFVSTFSLASGFASWLLVAPLLFFADGKPKSRAQITCWLIWISVAIASVLFYFHGYKQPVGHPSAWEVLRHPVLGLQFFLAYLGNPFAFGTELDPASFAQAIGGALLLPFVACLFYLWRRRRDVELLGSALPWVALSSIALVNAFLTMIGRLGFGLVGAIQSRYISFAIMLPLGLIFLAAVIRKHWRASSPADPIHHRVSMAWVCYATALGMLFLAATLHGLRFWPVLQHDRLSGKSILLLINVIEEPKAVRHYVHWNEGHVREWANLLDRMGYLHPRLLRSARIREIAYEVEDEKPGTFEHFDRTSDGNAEASGWAILPGDHRSADSVLLTYEDESGDPIIFARADVRVPREDVTAHFKEGAYQNSGWTKTWKASDVPAEAIRIRAWAFDAENCRAFPIGSTKL